MEVPWVKKIHYHFAWDALDMGTFAAFMAVYAPYIPAVYAQEFYWMSLALIVGGFIVTVTAYCKELRVKNLSCAREFEYAFIHPVQWPVMSG